MLGIESLPEREIFPLTEVPQERETEAPQERELYLFRCEAVDHIFRICTRLGQQRDVSHRAVWILDQVMVYVQSLPLEERRSYDNCMLERVKLVSCFMALKVESDEVLLYHSITVYANHKHTVRQLIDLEFAIADILGWRMTTRTLVQELAVFAETMNNLQTSFVPDMLRILDIALMDWRVNLFDVSVLFSCAWNLVAPEELHLGFTTDDEGACLDWMRPMAEFDGLSVKVRAFHTRRIREYFAPVAHV